MPRRASSSTGSQGDSLKSSYNPRDYVIPAQDHHGHSVRKQFRMQPAMSNEIQKILQAQKWPWITEGDFMRWAAWEAVKKCERMEEVTDSMYAVANNMIETSRMALMVVAFTASIEEAEKTVKELLDMGMEEEALKHLSELRDQAERVSEPIWKRKYLEVFEQKFGYLWKRNKAKGASLSAKGRGK